MCSPMTDICILRNVLWLSLWNCCFKPLCDSRRSVSLILRVIKPEEGKKLADSWGAAFMESSAKENEVNKVYFAWNVNRINPPDTWFSHNTDCCGGFQENHFGDGEGWWERAPRGEEVCSDVKVDPGTSSVSYITGDRRHNFTSLPIVTSQMPRCCSGTFLLHCDIRLI